MRTPKKDPGPDTQRIQQILAEIKKLEGRDLQLWSITALVLLLLGAGLGVVLVPDLGPLMVQSRYLPAILYGLITLIVLYNIYLLMQKRALRVARADLVRQLMRADTAETEAITDPLTGLFNRRYLDHALAVEAKRQGRSGGQLSVLLLDLDEFGEVNKRRGHLEGDRFLCEFAGLLKKVFRQTDTVVRFGGDEFLVLLPDTDLAQAQAAKQRLRNAVERWNDRQGNGGLRIEVSCGVAQYEDGTAPEVVLEAADAAMREMKQDKAHV